MRSSWRRSRGSARFPCPKHLSPARGALSAWTKRSRGSARCLTSWMRSSYMKYRGGRKRAYKGKKAYQMHLRRQVHAGLGNQPDGTWIDLDKQVDNSMRRDLINGYRIR